MPAHLSQPAWGQPSQTTPVVPLVDLTIQKNRRETALNRAAYGSVTPLCYGPVQIGGDIYATHYDKATGLLTTGLNVCIGEIDGFESVLFDGEQDIAGVTVNTYTGAAGQGVDPLLAAAIDNYTDTLDGVAHIVVQWYAGTFDAFPTILCDIRGKKVWNPTTAQTEYSANPALHAADFIGSTEYGQGIPVDDAALIVAQAECDALAGGEVRRICGTIIDEARPAADWVQVLRAHASCFVDYRDASAFLVPDRPAASVMTLTADDIRKGSMRIRKIDSGDIPTVVRVRYTNTQGDVHEEALSDPVEAAGVGSGATEFRQSIVPMLSVTRHSQAFREAIERLNKLHLSDLLVTFVMFDKGIKLRAGDVITVTHPYGLTAKELRIVEPPQQDTVGRWSIKAVEYDAAAYSDAVVAEPSTPDTELPVNGPPDAVTNVSATETTYQLKNGEYATRLNVTWDASPSPFVTGYEICLKDGPAIVWSGTASGAAAATAPVKELVTYQIEVRARTALYVGDAASTSYEPQGKFALPDAPATVNVFEVGGEVRANWSASTDIDAKRYHVRYSLTTETWEEGIDIDIVDALRIVSKDVPQGLHRIWVKTVDSVFNYSDDAAYADVTVTLDNDAFAVGNITPLAAGATVNMHATEQVRGSGVTQYYSDSGESASSIFGASALSGFTNGLLSYQAMPSDAEWLSEEMDLSTDQSGNWRADIDVTDYVGTADEELGLEPDGGSYSYSTLSRVATARKAKIRVKGGGQFRVDAPSGMLRADVVASEEVGEFTSVASGGAQVSLSKQYAGVRSITLTPEGSTALSVSFDNIQLNNGGVTTFDVYAFNSAGAQVVASGRWVFKGI